MMCHRVMINCLVLLKVVLVDLGDLMGHLEVEAAELVMGADSGLEQGGLTKIRTLIVTTY